MTQKRFYLSSVAGFAALLAASTASAAVISYRVTNPIGGGEATLGVQGAMTQATDYTTNLLWTQFNSAALHGVLTSLTFALYQDYQSVASATNTAVSSSAGNVATNINYDVRFLTNDIQLNGSTGQNLPSVSYSLAPGGSISTPLRTTVTPIVLTFTASDATTLAFFSGTSTAATELATSIFTTIHNSGGNTSGSQVTQFDADGIITYTYTTTGVPEPMTAALLMAGLGGLAAVRRRR